MCQTLDRHVHCTNADDSLFPFSAHVARIPGVASKDHENLTRVNNMYCDDKLLTG